MVRMTRLGRCGPRVSSLGLGCMNMAGVYGPADEASSLATLERALDLGINLLDTADAYSGGRNEELLAKVLKHRRPDIVVSTKFGMCHDAGGAQVGVRGDPAYVRSACEASLKRLGVDVIDVYFQHRVDPAVPIEETVGAMAELVREGKVRYLGLSEASAATIRRAHDTYPITALQSEYSFWTRDVEGSILSTCRDLGIGLVAFSPLGRGFLTGGLRRVEDLANDDRRRRLPRFQDENFERNATLVDGIRELAARHGCTAAQLSLAWVLSRGGDIVPIPGTKSIHHLLENVRALTISPDAVDFEYLELLAGPDEVAGARYPAAYVNMMGR